MACRITRKTKGFSLEGKIAGRIKPKKQGKPSIKRWPGNKKNRDSGRTGFSQISGEKAFKKKKERKNELSLIFLQSGIYCRTSSASMNS